MSQIYVIVIESASFSIRQFLLKPDDCLSLSFFNDNKGNLFCYVCKLHAESYEDSGFIFFCQTSVQSKLNLKH